MVLYIYELIVLFGNYPINSCFRPAIAIYKFLGNLIVYCSNDIQVEESHRVKPSDSCSAKPVHQEIQRLHNFIIDKRPATKRNWLLVNGASVIDRIYDLCLSTIHELMQNDIRGCHKNTC